MCKGVPHWCREGETHGSHTAVASDIPTHVWRGTIFEGRFPADRAPRSAGVCAASVCVRLVGVQHAVEEDSLASALAAFFLHVGPALQQPQVVVVRSAALRCGMSEAFRLAPKIVVAKSSFLRQSPEASTRARSPHRYGSSDRPRSIVLSHKHLRAARHVFCIVCVCAGVFACERA